MGRVALRSTCRPVILHKPFIGSVPFCSQCPLWVISGPFSCLPKMSAFGGKADIIQGVAKSPLIAISGHFAPFPNPIPYGQILVPTFPKLSSSAIIGPSLRSHLGNIGSHVQDRLSMECLSIQEGRKRAAAADEAPPLPEMPGAVRKRLVGRACMPEMQDKALLARGRRRHGVVGPVMRKRILAAIDELLSEERPEDTKVH